MKRYLKEQIFLNRLYNIDKKFVSFSTDSLYCKLLHWTREISTNKRERDQKHVWTIRSLSPRYSRYPSALWRITRAQSGVRSATQGGEKGATRRTKGHGGRKERMPCRFSRSSRDARGTREGARWMILRGRFDGGWKQVESGPEKGQPRREEEETETRSERGRGE